MIIRQLHILLFLPIIAGILVHCEKTDAEREANRLFVEAYQLTEAAHELEETDPEGTYEYYRQALEKIEKIIDNFPDTQIAVDVAQHRTRIGDITVGDLRRKVPLYASRAEALDNFHKLTLYAINMENEDLDRGLKRLEYARILFHNSKEEHHDDLVRTVIRQADQHWNREIIDRLYHDLSVHFSSISRWQQSIDMADRIQDPSLLSHSLQQLVSSGYITDGADVRALEHLYGYLNYIDPVSQLNLIEMICRNLFTSGRGSQALALVRERLPPPDEDRALEHIEALTDLSNVFSEHAEFEVSQQLIMQIGNIDSNYSDFALRDMASYLALHGRMGEAMKIVENFERDYFKHTTMAAIAVQNARSDSLDLAVSLLERIPVHVSEKTESLLEVAWIIADDENRADSLLQLALTGIGDIPSSLQRAHANLRVADIQIRHNKRSLAAEALENAEVQAREITGSESLNYLIAQLIERWISLGRPDRALDIAAWFRMSDPSFDDLVPGLFSYAINRGYHDFARSLAVMTDRRARFQYILVEVYLDLGLVSQPSELAYEIRNYYWRSRALAKLTTGLINKVNLAAAEKAATDILLTMQRIRDLDEKKLALFHVSALLSSAGITMNDERRALTVELLGGFDL